MPKISLASDCVTIAAVAPVSIGAGSSSLTGWISVAGFKRLKFSLLVGTITSTGVVNFSINQATSSTGAGSKALAGAAITAITVSNGVAEISINGDALDTNNGFAYVQAVPIVTTAAAVLGFLAQGEPTATPPTNPAIVVQSIYLP